MIISKERIGGNLKEVELFMFDDEDVRKEVEALKQDLDNDMTVMDASVENFMNSGFMSYPVIKSRFDDADTEVMPHHWQGVDPLLFHLAIWAILNLEILNMSEEDRQTEYLEKKWAHKKSRIETDISTFASKLKSVELEQSRLLDLKVGFQKINEKCLAYFRARKSGKSYKSFDTDFCVKIFKACRALGQTGKVQLKMNQNNAEILGVLDRAECLKSFKKELISYLGVSNEEDLLSERSGASEDECNVSCENNEAPKKEMAGRESMKNTVFAYRIH